MRQEEEKQALHAEEKTPDQEKREGRRDIPDFFQLPQSLVTNEFHTSFFPFFFPLFVFIRIFLAFQSSLAVLLMFLCVLLGASYFVKSEKQLNRIAHTQTGRKKDAVLSVFLASEPWIHSLLIRVLL